MIESTQKTAADRYLLSFTTGATLVNESIAVAELQCELNNWEAVKAHVLQRNTFQSHTFGSLKKQYGEVSRRLRYLSLNEARRRRQTQVPLVWQSAEESIGAELMLVLEGEHCVKRVFRQLTSKGK